MPPGEESRRAIDDVFRLIGSGQLQQAEERCASLLSAQPNDVNLPGLHGAILLKLGRNVEAETQLRKTITLEPQFAKPHEDLGRLLLGQDDACLEFYKNRRPVNTASAEQVREPNYSDSVDYWKNYEAELGPVKEILESVLAE